MILSDIDIKEYISSGDINISSLEIKDIGSASIDVHIGDTYSKQIISENPVDLHDNKCQYKIKSTDNTDITLLPGSFKLLTTKEVITISTKIVGFIIGKSTTARLGLTIEEANMIQPGFSGNITLEVRNNSANIIKLHVGDPIGQIYFETLKTEASKYCGKYQNQHGATPAIISPER